MVFLEFSFLRSKSVHQQPKSSSWSPWPASQHYLITATLGTLELLLMVRGQDGGETVAMTQSWEGLMEASEWLHLCFSEGEVVVVSMSRCQPFLATATQDRARFSGTCESLCQKEQKERSALGVTSCNNCVRWPGWHLKGPVYFRPQNSPGIWSPHSHATASARWHQPSLLPGPCYIL